MKKDIKIELFALCQGAHNWDGHLTIVNTLDEFIVHSLPARVTFGLAIKLFIYPNVSGDKKLKLSIIQKSSGKKILDDIPIDLHIESSDKPSHINIALNLQNVLFEESGAFDIHLELDDKRLDDFAFEVIKNEL